MITTYTVNIAHDRMVDTDSAIAAFLRQHPDASVNDALDYLFSVGVQVALALNYVQIPMNNEPPTEAGPGWAALDEVLMP